MKKHHNDSIEFHSIANIFPLMSESEFESLKADIKKYGLLNPIVLFNGKIVDGRNRYKACIATGIKPKFINYSGKESELFNYVISLNINRRHLTISQKACISIDLIPTIEIQTKERHSKNMSALRKTGKIEEKAPNTLQIVSSIFGISERVISEAKKLHSESIELFNRVLKGEITLNKAKTLLKLDVQTFANMQKCENENVLNDYIFTKTDLRKISEYMQEFEVSELKAKAFIIKHKAKISNGIKAGANKPKSDFKEIKFLIAENDKLLLQKLAKEKHLSLSEILRNLVKDNVL